MTSTKERGKILSHQLREGSSWSLIASGGESHARPEHSWKSGGEMTSLPNTVKGMEATSVQRDGDESSFREK